MRARIQQNRRKAPAKSQLLKAEDTPEQTLRHVQNLVAAA